MIRRYRSDPPPYPLAPGRRLMLMLVCAGLVGCATDHDPVVRHSLALTTMHLPLALQGENTVMKIELPSGEQRIEPGQFQHDEVCYMSAGKFRIDCFGDGSALNLGPTDSNDLLTDVPGWKLQPALDDERARQALQMYAVLTLVAGSVDRLPATLADYIQVPGTHLTEALDLTEELLTKEQLKLRGFARGGNFNVTVQLSDAGREKLEDALDEAGDSGGQLQMVRERVSAHRAHARAVKVRSLKKHSPND